MAKINYLEIVEMLSEHTKGQMKAKLDHIIERKKALKDEDSELDLELDLTLRALQGGERDE